MRSDKHASGIFYQAVLFSTSENFGLPGVQETEATITPASSFTNCAAPSNFTSCAPSPSQRPSSPNAPSVAETHLAVKKVVVQDLGICVAEKGTGVAVPLSTMRKEAPRR